MVLDADLLANPGSLAEVAPQEAARDDADVLRLFDAFELSVRSMPVELPMSSQRLLAFLALADRPANRRHVAFSLWPDRTEERAVGNLRSALWRVRRLGLGLVEAVGSRLALGREVVVDVHQVDGTAAAIAAGAMPTDLRDVRRVLTGGELLPDWYDPWLDLARERLRQTRLHAIEGLSHLLLERGRSDAAIDVGLAAVATEPLRESAHRAVVRAHAAEGNAAEALRQYETYRSLAFNELGILPSPRMEELVAPLRAVPGPGRR